MSTVSVVLATYNGEEFLESQLESIRLQSRPADEVIICDDASTDGTAEKVNNFIKEHQLKNWCFLPYGENVGFIKNFHRGLSEAHGDIVFLCDQDDEWRQDKIETMCNFFERHPDTLSLCTALNPVDRDGNEKQIPSKKGTTNCSLVNKKVYEGDYIKIFLPQAFRCNPSAGCTMAVSRKILDLYCEKSSTAVPHDHELNLLAANMGGLYFLNIPLTRYRLHGKNTLGLKGKSQTRAEIAAEKYHFAEALSLYGAPFALMFSVRVSALSKRSAFMIIKLITNHYYRKFFTPREILGDILYCLKGR